MEKLTPLRRGLWGLVGGLITVGVKYLGQDHYWVSVLIDTRQYDHIPGVIFFYVGLIVVFVPAAIAFAIASKENSPMKLLQAAVALPALLTTYMGGAKAETPGFSRYFSELVLSSAQAAEPGSPSQSKGFWEGFVLPLGIGKDEQRYRVVVGSFKDEQAAAKKAEQINKLDPTLKAIVGDKRLFNDYYPVVIGDYSVYPEARALKNKVSEKLGIDDVYLSPYRFP